MIDLEKIKKEKTIDELLKFSILNIDKPSGPTSFQVSNYIKKLLNLRKTSHFGTLDPKVTGVLPVALNRACRLSTWFMKKDKEYIGIMRVHKQIEDEQLKDYIKRFTGRIIQKPPVKSRVKRQEREREVYEFQILEQENKDFLFHVKCEAGTYIRKLIHDLGKEIGGAHMLELRRTGAGIFSEKDEEFVNLYELEKAVKKYKNGDERSLRKILIPGEIVAKIMPVVEIKKDNLKKILTGKPIFKSDLKTEIKEKGVVAVFCNNKFIEVAKVVNKGYIFAKPEFVLN